MGGMRCGRDVIRTQPVGQPGLRFIGVIPGRASGRGLKPGVRGPRTRPAGAWTAIAGDYSPADAVRA